VSWQQGINYLKARFCVSFLVIKFIFTLRIVLHLQEQEAREKAFQKPEESNFAGGEYYPSRFKQ